jgi:hypothetical protein
MTKLAVISIAALGVCLPAPAQQRAALLGPHLRTLIAAPNLARQHIPQLAEFGFARQRAVP